MNYLVDTHYLLWALIEPSGISTSVMEILTDTRTVAFASKISFWEIALKYSIGKLRLEGTTPEEILDAASAAGFRIFDISGEDLAASHRLPFIADHKDPFDRLIVWQCIRNDMTLLTADRRLEGYKPHGLKIVI
ncbi:MAG: type II toxin-antitoxin system VapC family toxin [Spirochaetales bacterium]|nr:type II toxin-antitoxin system VapC family toxin [Spirochaetales bacterium]